MYLPRRTAGFPGRRKRCKDTVEGDTSSEVAKVFILHLSKSTDTCVKKSTFIQVKVLIQLIYLSKSNKAYVLKRVQVKAKNIFRH